MRGQGSRAIDSEMVGYKLREVVDVRFLVDELRISSDGFIHEVR
jgi:hypothetical protein